MNRVSLLAAALLLPMPAWAAPPPENAERVERGRYLVQIAGCNDCHTENYLQAPDQVPESAWLLGAGLGWSGPWGTTYASNLRLLLPQLSEAQWLQLARNANYRPPMPNHALRLMSDQDLLSFHRFVSHLGPAGTPAPAFVPPPGKPAGPLVVFPSPAP